VRVFQYQDIIKKFLIVQPNDMEPGALFQQDTAPYVSFKKPSKPWHQLLWKFYPIVAGLSLGRQGNRNSRLWISRYEFVENTV
jgi:hypothetical protein